MACDGAAVFKGLLFVLCVVCLVYKRYTDNEALKVFYQLEKLSREWPLLNNITWDENGALLADLTFGGFAIVTLGLLVGAVTGELRRIRNLVCFYQVLGCIMFLVVGGLCLAAIDSVPHHLVDNAIVLGVLSILTGILFLADLAVTGSRGLSTQDKTPVQVVSPKAAEAKKLQEKKAITKEVDETKSKKTAGNGVIKELRSSLKRKKTVEDLDGRGVVVEKERSVEFEKVKNAKTEIETVDRSDNRSTSERSVVEHDDDFERSTIERTGLERSGVERTGFERSQLERSGFERLANTKSDFDRSGVDKSRLGRDEVDNPKFDERFTYERSGDEYRQYGRKRLDNRGFPRSTSVDSGRFSSEQRFRSEFLNAEKERWLEREGERHVSVVEGTYDPRRSRPTSMMEVELDEHYLQPDYYVEKRPVSREERLQRLQDQKVSSSSSRQQHELHFSDDEYQQAQLPSVSFLLAERGRKMLPSVKSSPLERLQEVTSSSSGAGKPRYFYNNRDPASGASAPPSPHSPGGNPPTPRTPGYMLHTPHTPGGDPPTPQTPGYVLHTASTWQDADKTPSTVSDRIQHWFKSRPQGKAP